MVIIINFFLAVCLFSTFKSIDKFMASVHIEKITYDGPYMVVKANGKRYRVRIEQVSTRLMRADQKQRDSIRFSPAGFTVRWPLLDLEMSVSGLMQMAQLSW